MYYILISVGVVTIISSMTYVAYYIKNKNNKKQKIQITKMISNSNINNEYKYISFDELDENSYLLLPY